jgi:predicted site-specific integrase-resolvase
MEIIIVKTCKQIANEWGISERTVNELCKSGKISGAVKNGRVWQIPDDAIRPVDRRISSGKYAKKNRAGIS